MTSGAEKARLCGCLMEGTREALPGVLSSSEVDLIEWRLDSFIGRHGLSETMEMLPLLSSGSRKPVLVTNRHRRDGGIFEGSDEDRIEILVKAAKAGAEWVDLEDSLDAAVFADFAYMEKRVLVSHHDFSGTPPAASLRSKVEKMAKIGTGAIKIATLARSPEDNLRILELIPFAREDLKVEVVAFCMGPVGRWSRAISLLLGGAWTYVRLPDQTAAAPGQYTATEMRSLLAMLDG